MTQPELKAHNYMPEEDWGEKVHSTQKDFSFEERN